MSRDGGGWTPAAYLNSVQFNQMISSTGLVAHSSWMLPRLGGCTTDANCTNAPGLKCTAHKSGARFCLGTGPIGTSATPQYSIPGPPENYTGTTSPTSAGYFSMAMGVASLQTTFAGNGRGNLGLHSFYSSQTIYEMRWDAYRNGQRVYSSGIFNPNGFGIPVDGDGQMMRAGGAAFEWTQGSPPYMSSLAYPESNGGTGAQYSAYYGYDSDFNGTPSLLFRGRGWGFLTQRYGAGSVNWLHARVFPRGFNAGSLSGVYAGFWAAAYGYPQGDARYNNYPMAQRFGLCNSFDRVCTPTVHPASQYPSTFTQAELTDPNGGTEITAGTPGMAFVLWAR
jgi:hypothetical protein